MALRAKRSILVAVLVLVLAGVAAAGADAQTRKPAPNGDDRELFSFVLTMDKVKRLSTAAKEFHALEKRQPEADSDGPPNRSISGMVQAIQRLPGAAGVLARNKWTAREYAVGFLALIQSTMMVGLKQAGTYAEYPADMRALVSPANLAFVERHYAEIQKLMPDWSSEPEDQGGQPQNGKPYSGDASSLPGVIRPLQDLTVGQTVEIGPGRMATAAEIRTMRAELTAVVEVLKPMPYFARPIGFSSTPRIGFHPASTNWRGRRLWPLAGTAEVISYLNFIDRAGNLRIAAGPLRGDDMESQGIRLSANDIGCVFDGAAFFTDSLGPVFQKPREEEEHRFPKFAKCVILTQRREPLYVPVARERMLRFEMGIADEALRQAEAMMAKVPAAHRKDFEVMVSERRGALERVRATLAAMSPAERTAPEETLVEPNPRFFDLTRLDRIQVLAVRLGLSDEEGEFLSQVDWKGLLALAR